MSWAMAVGATVAIVGGIIKGSKAKKAKRRAEAEQKRKAAQIARFEANRQAVINPYSDVKSLAGLAKDLSGEMSNPYAALGVATSAAEIQMEQTDLALAATLDTLQATGASAGGATALANAAAKSKKDVAANIEQQEAQNEKLSAQGEAELQSKQIAEQQRMQGIQISEGGRVQNAQAQGKAFEFNAQENRDQATLDRMSGQESQARQNVAQANADGQAAISGMISGVSSAVGGKLSSGGFSGGGGGGGSTSNQFSSGNYNTGGSGTGFTPNTNYSAQMMGSDRRLKKNIKKISRSASGLNIYSFEYIDKSFGGGTYSGVMSDEIPIGAVVAHEDGFDRVDYSKLDVEFKKIK
tara:strand:- start:4952 stop:6010 length:1059 start_codon:yes stop_codon:yes gene_type:complete